VQGESVNKHRDSGKRRRRRRKRYLLTRTSQGRVALLTNPLAHLDVELLYHMVVQVHWLGLYVVRGQQLEVIEVQPGSSPSGGAANRGVARETAKGGRRGGNSGRTIKRVRR
jgi:hypothetical protein